MLPITHCAKPNHHHGFSRIAAIFSAAVLALPGTAQEGTDDDRVHEVIIVTAEKREEDILSVPVTMTAFSQDMIEELGMTGDEDLEQLVPGLQFAYDSEGNGITIRGIGTQKAVEYNADLAVAFYVDGVYTNDVYGLAPNLFDVERVEVARGPQGTLNGRNSIAGAVSYVNRKPSDDWDAQVLVEFTDTVTQRYNAAWGGPITDEVSFRLTGGYYEGDGWQENTGIGDNYAAPDQYTFAPQLRYETDRLDINLRRQVARDRGTSRAPVRMVDVDRDSPTYLLGGIWPVTNYLYLYQKPLPGIANCDPAQFRDRGGFCDELENRVLSNRSSIQDHETDRWSLNTDVAVGDLARHRTRCTDGSLYRATGRVRFSNTRRTSTAPRSGARRWSGRSTPPTSSESPATTTTSTRRSDRTWPISTATGTATRWARSSTAGSTRRPASGWRPNSPTCATTRATGCRRCRTTKVP